MYTPMFQIHTSVWPSEVKSNQEYLNKDSSHQFYALPEGEYYKNYNPFDRRLYLIFLSRFNFRSTIVVTRRSVRVAVSRCVFLN